MSYNHYRGIQRVVTLITLFVLMASFYFEYVLQLRPCPLCLMQRLMVMILLAIGMMQCFNRSLKWANRLSWLQMLIALGGVYFAGRQSWLQMLPANNTQSCLPGLDVLIRYFPWQDVLHALMFGASDCSDISWQWLGLTMPIWAALYFIGVFLAGFLSRYFLKRL